MVGVLATSVPADLEEVQGKQSTQGKQSKLRLCWMDLARAGLCWPSNLVFTLCTKLSWYEHDLVNLKALAKDYSLPATSSLDVTLLADKLRYLKVRYGETRTSHRFDDALDYLLSCTQKPTMQCGEADKYMPYLCTCVDWELIRVQPMRYMLNQKDKRTYWLCALVCVVGAAHGFASLVKHAAGVPGGLVLRIVNVLRPLTPLFVLVNMSNLGVQVGTHKRARV